MQIFLRHLTIFLLSAPGVCNLAAQVQQESESNSSSFSQVQIDFFENKIRPILVDHCLQCHGANQEKIRGGLLLTSRNHILKGGDSGPAIVPGEPAASLLIHSVRYEDFEMPPDGQLSEEQIADFVKWIEMGAADPRDPDAATTATETTIDIEAGKQFWAFQPVAEVSIAGMPSDNWSRSDIDRLIFRELDKSGIKPVADADRETLIRRAYIALIGLPPTIRQIDRFVDDPDDLETAFAKVVDGLLDSDHFGERWGRHWLDVARFAESSGGGRSLMFPDAWRFRDYVIESYNKDKPFDQFIREQIAGDLLKYKSHDQKIEQIVATGLLALGPTNYEQQDKELLRMEVIDEQVDTIGRAFMGLTLGCARCHDHKFDPIPMTDYYALAGIFGSTMSLVDGNVSKFVESPLATEAELKVREKYREQVAQLSKQLAEAQARLKELGGDSAKPNNKSVDAANLPGVIIDDRAAKLKGRWKASTYSAKFVDGRYLHDEDKDKGDKQAVFAPKLTMGGRYEVRVSYSAGGNRASNVPVTIDHQDGKTTVLINQSQEPAIDGLFVSVGTYRFEADNQSTITISAADTDGHVIVDAVQLVAVDHEPKANIVADVQPPSSETRETEADITTASPEIRVARKRIAELDARLKELKKHAPHAVAVAMSVRDAVDPQDGPLYIRGSVRRPGPTVPRGFVTVCCSDSARPDLAADQSGRLQLAKWLSSPDHPLTARVYVNRVWRHLFGTGLVATPDNFGMMGQRPSHPLLLDYLANEFVKEGWSTKELIRNIMMSRVYRLATADDAVASSIDPENHLLWNANRRRVDAEVLRDSILFVSGELDLQPGGRTIRKITEYDLGYEFDTVRRSVYVPAFRNSMLDLFEVFDFANPNLVTGHRNASTLPTQALFLMNSPLVIEQSRKAAEKLLQREGLTDAGRIEFVYRQVLGRRPNAAENAKTIEYLKSFAKAQEAWSSVYHALFASLDFRYVE